MVESIYIPSIYLRQSPAADCFSILLKGSRKCTCNCRREESSFNSTTNTAPFERTIYVSVCRVVGYTHVFFYYYYYFYYISVSFKRLSSFVWRIAFGFYRSMFQFLGNMQQANKRIYILAESAHRHILNSHPLLFPAAIARILHL